MTPEPTDPLRASSVNVVNATEAFDSTRLTTELRFPDGHSIRLPTTLLLEHSAASDTLDLQASISAAPADESVTIPIMEERLKVDKRTVVTGTVRLDKHVGIYEEALDIPLAVRSFDIERLVLNQPVETAPPVRQEGDVTIYPLVEEQLILTKQLILREELRVTRRDTERRDTRIVTLERESIEVTRS